MREETPSERASLVLLGLALFALYLVTHPYRGIHGDALIYVTRAWAPPALVDGDLLFAHERQTNLTLFGALLSLFNRVLPVGEAARALALCGVAVWFSGMTALVRALALAAHLPGRAALAMAALVALAPLSYSAGSSFTAGEFLAVPRPFAEGFVLLAFAALLESRWRVGVLALLLGVAFHPLMGAAGAAVAFVWAALREPRLWLMAIAGALAAWIGAALDAPYFRDLLTTFDAEWLALLRARTSYLFLSQAPLTFWTDALLRAVILVIVARLCVAPLRRLLVAVNVASAAAVVLSLSFADLWPSVLVTQLQPWRVLFIPAVLAPACVILIAARAEVSQMRVTLALIACALISRDAPALSLVFTLGVLAFQHEAAARVSTLRVEALLWMIAAAAWVGFDVLNLIAFREMLARAPSGAEIPWGYFWALRPLALPGSALVILFARGEGAPRLAASACGLMAAGLLAAWRFDDRPAPDVSLEAPRVTPLELIAADDRPVLWLGLGKEAWYWHRRPNWAAPVQASSIVFSRDLARAWRARMGVLTDLEIVEPEAIRNQGAAAPKAPASATVAALCGRADAPAALVAPLRAGEAAPDGARRLDAPAPSYPFKAGESAGFETIDGYAVWTCARKATD